MIINTWHALVSQSPLCKPSDMTSVGVSRCASPSSHVFYGFAHLKNELHVPVILYIYWCWVNSAQVQIQYFVRLHEIYLVISIMQTHTQDGGPRNGTWTDICQLWNLTKMQSMRKMWKWGLRITCRAIMDVMYGTLQYFPYHMGHAQGKYMGHGWVTTFHSILWGAITYPPCRYLLVTSKHKKIQP